MASTQEALLMRSSLWAGASASNSEGNSPSVVVLGMGRMPAQLVGKSKLTSGRVPTMYLLASKPKSRFVGQLSSAL